MPLKEKTRTPIKKQRRQRTSEFGGRGEVKRGTGGDISKVSGRDERDSKKREERIMETKRTSSQKEVEQAD
ncbi:unnamed protein product [Brassica rapa subsp. trilocularis]|uniref:(rape) hypothetical protein n=1 Tax=Brassica napus TaxID=3708 RepID=A0A816Y8B3_BRANA|nr:unnamed protein product [Brassica napus]